MENPSINVEKVEEYRDIVMKYYSNIKNIHEKRDGYFKNKEDIQSQKRPIEYIGDFDREIYEKYNMSDNTTDNKYNILLMFDEYYCDIIDKYLFDTLSNE